MIILCWTERISRLYFFLVGQKRVSNLFVFTSLSDREERKLWWLQISFSIQTLTLIFWNEKHSDTFLFIMVIVESNSVCNHARTTAKRESDLSITSMITDRIRRQERESDLSITSMITDRIRRQEVLLPINHNRYNFRKKILLGQKSPVEIILEILQSFLFFRVNGCC